MENTTNAILKLENQFMDEMWKNHDFDLYYTLPSREKVDYFWVHKKSNTYNQFSKVDYFYHYLRFKNEKISFKIHLLHPQKKEGDSLIQNFLISHWTPQLKLHELLDSFSLTISDSVILNLLDKLPLSSEQKIQEVENLHSQQLLLSNFSEHDLYFFYHFLQKNSEKPFLDDFLFSFFEKRKEQIDIHNSPLIESFLCDIYQNKQELKQYYSLFPKIKTYTEFISFDIFKIPNQKLLLSTQIDIKKGADIAVQGTNNFYNLFKYFMTIYSQQYSIDYTLEKGQNNYILNIYSQNNNENQNIDEKHLQTRFELLFNKNLFTIKTEESLIILSKFDLDESLKQNPISEKVLKI